MAAYLDQALRLSPSRLDLADRAYIKLGRSGLATEYRARFTFLAGNPQRAYQLFLQALTLYRQENNEIAANHIERWLDVHRKYSDDEKKPQLPVEAPQQQLKRENLPVPQLKPAHLDTPTEIEPIVLMTDGDVLTGSGFIANNGNWVITNRHVVEGAERVIVRDGLGRVRYVTEYILDADQDIARLVLSQPYPQSQAINSSDIIDPVAGDELFLMGFPLSGVLGAHHERKCHHSCSQDSAGPGERKDDSELLKEAADRTLGAEQNQQEVPCDYGWENQWQMDKSVDDLFPEKLFARQEPCDPDAEWKTCEGGPHGHA